MKKILVIVSLILVILYWAWSYYDDIQNNRILSTFQCDVGSIDLRLHVGPDWFVGDVVSYSLEYSGVGLKSKTIFSSGYMSNYSYGSQDVDLLPLPINSSIPVVQLDPDNAGNANLYLNPDAKHGKQGIDTQSFVNISQCLLQNKEKIEENMRTVANNVHGRVRRRSSSLLRMQDVSLNGVVHMDKNELINKIIDVVGRKDLNIIFEGENKQVYIEWSGEIKMSQWGHEARTISDIFSLDVDNPYQIFIDENVLSTINANGQSFREYVLEVQDKIGISFQTNSIDLVDKKETQLETIKQIKQNKTDTTEIPTGWTSTSHKTFGIQFSHPNDWNVSEVNERTSVNGSLVEMIRVYPEGMDPTIVYFFTTQEPLTRARNIALTKSNITESKFNEITLNGHSATQRTDFFTNNDCTQTVTVIEDDNTIYGSEIVECPTHQDRHDQIRIDIADSLEIL